MSCTSQGGALAGCGRGETAGQGQGHGGHQGRASVPAGTGAAGRVDADQDISPYRTAHAAVYYDAYDGCMRGALHSIPVADTKPHPDQQQGLRKHKLKVAAAAEDVMEEVPEPATPVAAAPPPYCANTFLHTPLTRMHIVTAKVGTAPSACAWGTCSGALWRPTLGARLCA